MVVLPSLLLTLAPALADDEQPCAEPTTTADVDGDLTQAEAAYAALDVNAFLAAMDHAAEVLPCVSDPVPRHLAARLHRFEGLRGFVQRKPTRSMAAFAAARSIEPAYVFPETLVPFGNPALQDYNALDPSSGRTVEVPEKTDGRLQFDGTVSLNRPIDRPAVLQLFSGEGGVEHTTYLWGHNEMPPYDTIAPPPEPEPVAPPPPVSTAPRHPVNVPLLVATTAATVATGSLYAASWASRSAWASADDPDRVVPLRKKTNGLVVASSAAAGVAVGLGVTTVVEARF